MWVDSYYTFSHMKIFFLRRMRPVLDDSVLTIIGPLEFIQIFKTILSTVYEVSYSDLRTCFRPIRKFRFYASYLKLRTRIHFFQKWKLYENVNFHFRVRRTLYSVVCPLMWWTSISSCWNFWKIYIYFFFR